MNNNSSDSSFYNTSLESSSELEDLSIRPSSIDSFVGQEKIKTNLRIYINSAKSKQKCLDHVIFYGPPGLGKTSLANIIAKEMDSGIKSTSGPMLSKPGDLAAILSNISENDILFIDEIHRTSIQSEEILYSAMEDFNIDIVIGTGPAARTMSIKIPPFTLVGATTRFGMISSPLRNRFGISIRIDFYEDDELKKIVESFANKSSSISPKAALKIAQISRGTPRIAIKIAKRMLDFAHHMNKENIDEDVVRFGMEKLSITHQGFDILDQKYIRFIRDFYGGGPVGIDTIAAGISESKDTIEDSIEPFLIQKGFVEKTQKGRVVNLNEIEI